MKSARLVLACIALVATPLIAFAAPGDPRLVNGVLEWPRTVTNEPFVIVRGDDGVLYYIGLGSARRDGTATAGVRVAVLGIEGRTAHEITAVGFGSGTTTEAALAQLQGARTPATPAPPAAASAPPVTAPAATPAPATAPPAPTVAAPTAPAVAAPAAAPASNGAAAAPSAPAAASPKPTAPAAAPTVQAAPSVAPTTPAPAPAVSPTPPPAAPNGSTAAITATAPAAMPPGVVPTAATSPAATHPTAPMVPVDDRRWTEVSGEIEAIVGRTVMLKVDGGRVTVDVSSLSGNLERMVGPGSKVKFYGVPVELRFKAMGFIDPDARGRVR